MKCKSSVLFCICLLVSSAAEAQTSRHQIEKHRSPDNNLFALVTSNKAPEATRESRVELHSASGELLAKKDYFSPDGEHGFGLTKAAWTPDSQFFVYSLESSGGHQSWHSPVWFYSRSRDRIFSLDDALRDSVSNPVFAIHAPTK